MQRSLERLEPSLGTDNAVWEIGQRPVVAFAMNPEMGRHVFDSKTIERLRTACVVPDVNPIVETRDPSNAKLLAETEILLTSWGAPRLDADFLRLTPKLQLVVHAAGSVHFLMSPELLATGIRISHAAAANAIPVAEFTLAAILFAGKQAFHFRNLYAQERSSLHAIKHAAVELGNFGHTIGIIGASHVGRRVIDFLRPFEWTVLLYDPYLSNDEAEQLGVQLVSLDHLLASSEIVSLHAPLRPATRHMLNGQRLGLLRDGATLINTARGDLVDPSALERELSQGRIFAILDVTEPDVLPAQSPLYDLSNVFLTPHIAGALGTERRRLGALAVDEIERFVRGAELKHAINPAHLDRLA